MSRILRRPMFRGGRVSSYGTGIASGLADGGMPPKRGLVTGPGGYAGEYASGWNRIWGNPTSTGNVTGGQVVDKATKTLESRIAGKGRNLLRWMKKPDTGLTGWAMRNFPKVLRTGAYAAPVWAALEGSEAQAELIDKASDKGMLDDFGESVEFADGRILPSYEFAETVDPSEFTVETGLLKTDEEKEKEADEAEKVRLKAMKAMTTDDAYTEREVNEETGEPVKLTAKEMVAENKKLFAELLGSKKARGQDISEMLLGFAGAEGDTVWDKSKAFFRDEAKRPGKAQKIEETAAALAINDYIAGKRSLENLKQTLGIVDYKIKKASEAGQLTGGSKNWVADLTKESTLQKGGVTDLSVIRSVLFKTTGKNVSVVSKGGKNLNDIDSEDLNIGFNIVSHKGGKTIVEKFEDGTVKERTDLPIT